MARAEHTVINLLSPPDDEEALSPAQMVTELTLGLRRSYSSTARGQAALLAAWWLPDDCPMPPS